MSAKSIEGGEGFDAVALLQESQTDEKEEFSQPCSSGCTPGGPPQRPPPGPPAGLPQGTGGPGPDSTDPPEEGRGRRLLRTAAIAAGAVTGGAVAVGAVPVVLGAVGFTGAGIAASSLAAKMMSAAAIANGGGVAAGSLVTTLQSVGAAGLSTSSNVLLGLAGSSVGAWLGKLGKKGSSPPPAEPHTEADRDPHVGGDAQDGSPPNDKPPASQNSSEEDKK